MIANTITTGIPGYVITIIFNTVIWCKNIVLINKIYRKYSEAV